MIILIIFLTILVGLNIMYTLALYVYISKLHKMFNEALLHIAKEFESMKTELKSKIGLRAGEKIAATTLYFTNVDISKGDTKEPMDCITVLEYSNAPDEARVNE